MAVAVDLVPDAPSVPRVSIVCDAKILRTAVSRVARCTDSRSAIPALSQMKISATADGITLSATDLSVDVRASVTADVRSTGDVLVPAAQLVDSLRNARGEVSLAHSGSALHVRTTNAGWFVLAAGDPKDFPKLPDPPAAIDVVIPATELARMVGRTIHAMGVDESRQHLYGALLQRERNDLHLVAVDGHRLAKAECGNDGSDFAALIHRRGIEELARWIDHVDGDVTIRRTDSRVFFVMDQVTISARIIDAAFPAWREVIPQHHDAVATFDRKEMLSALRAVKLRTKAGVRFAFKAMSDAIVVSTSDGDHDASVSVRATMRGPFPGHVGFQHRYIVDALSAAEDEAVTLEVSGELDPVRIAAADSSTFVIMPMRI